MVKYALKLIKLQNMHYNFTYLSTVYYETHIVLAFDIVRPMTWLNFWNWRREGPKTNIYLNISFFVLQLIIKKFISKKNNKLKNRLLDINELQMTFF